jgi:amidase
MSHRCQSRVREHLPACVRQVYETLMASSAAGFGVDPGISYKRWFDHNERREEFCQCWSRFFTEWDVLICPSYSMVAFPKDETPPADGQQMGTNRTLDRDGERIPYWQSQFWPILTNTCRLPSTTFPAGLGSTSGMPVGLNAVGAEFDDLKTIHFAQLLATECGAPYTYTAPPFALAAAVTSPKL